MKIVLMLATLTLTITSFATPRPGGKPEGRREGVTTGRASEALVRFNRSCSESLGSEINVRLPETLKPEEMTTLVQRAEVLSETLKIREVELKEDSLKRTELSNILESLNGALQARSRFVDYLTNAREAKIESTREANEVAQDLINLIDNAFTIIDAKVKDSPDAPVSTAQILRVLDVLGSVNRARLTKEDLIAFESSIKDIFGNQYSIKQVARCR